jgi:predicted regulator of Ras-like GTPase activity (Roadblock/LC7/MglB family)
MEHGKRYSDDEKKEILRFRENHTFQETSDKFNISMMTLFRWNQQLRNPEKEIIRDEKKMDMVAIYNEENKDEKFKAKAIEMAKVLEVLKFIKGVKAIALIKDDGSLITMLATKDTQDVDLNGIVAATLSLGQRASDQLVLGNLEIMLIKSKKGVLFVIGAGRHTVITLLFDEQGDLKHLFGEEFTNIDRVKQIIGESYH